MTQFGSPDRWLGFIDSRVPAIIRIVVETWNSLPAPYCDDLEDDVTERFCGALRRARGRCELPFRIDIQLVELSPAAGEDQGRMDIVFSPPVPREDIYFCLECKRVNVRTATGIRRYFAEYVTNGMLRFVRGQYAKEVQHGGMVAYVLDGDVVSAVTGIESNIARHVDELGLDPPGAFSSSSHYPGDSRIRETIHLRCRGLPKFRMHHMFMPGNPSAGFRPNDS